MGLGGGWLSAEEQPLRLTASGCAASPLRTETPLSGRSGVAHGLFSDSRTDPPSVRRCSARLIRQAETLELQPRSRPPSSHTMAFAPKRSTFRFAAPRNPGWVDFAPKRPFGTFRCCGRLIFRFRTDPPSVRRCSARLIRQAETLKLQTAFAAPRSGDTMAFSTKRSTPSRFAARTLRVTSHRNVLGTFRCSVRLIRLCRNARTSAAFAAYEGELRMLLQTLL